MELSGNCYKIRLFCALTGLQYESVAVDLAQGEHKEAAFRQLNPRGQVPVLDDDGIVIWDSMAILIYLARKYGDPRWLPLEAEPLAQVMQWLALSQNELLYGLARARAVKLFNRPWEISQCQELGRLGLAALESHLRNHPWLVDPRPTLADISCYPYVALAPEGGVSLNDFSHTRQWVSRVQSLPGYIGMPGIQSSPWRG